MQYFRPRNANFESVDGFALMPASLFDAGKPDMEFVLVGFQMTISPSHPVNGTGMKKVRDRVQEIAKAYRVVPHPVQAPAPTRAVPRRGAKPGAAAEPPPEPLPFDAYLVFVVSSDQVIKKQEVKQKAGEPFVDPDSVARRQFSISLGSGFDRFFKALNGWRA